MPSPTRAAPPVLDSKAEAPVTEGLVARTRLFKILDAAPARSVVWIAAPPGAGKSSLAASWIEARRAVVPHAQTLWYGMDDGDHDPVGFLARLRGIVAQGPDADRLPRLTPEATVELSSFAQRWFKELRGRAREPWLFAFDDVHRLPETSTTWVLLQALMAAQKAADRIVFLSRLDAPEPVKAITPGKRLTQISDLRVHLDEFEDFARTPKIGDALTFEAFRDKVQHTGGWISELAAPPQRPSLRTMADTGSGPAASTTVARFPTTERDVLLKIAFLQGGSETEWRALGGDGAVALLNHLAASTGLVSRRVNGDLRKHDLFHGNLIYVAVQTLPSDALNRARIAAADVLTARQDYRSAVRLLVEAGAVDRARTLALEQAPVLTHSGRNREFIDIATALPAPVRGEAMLRSWEAHARLPFEPGVAREMLRDVRMNSDPRTQPAEFALAISGELQSSLVNWSEHRSLPDLVAELDRHPIATDRLPLTIRARLTIARAMALMFGWPTHPDILATCTLIETLLPALPAAQQLILGSAYVNYLVWWRGDVRAARTYCDKLNPLAHRVDMPPLAVMVWHYGAISCAYRDGDGDAVERLTSEATTFAEKWGVSYRLSDVYWINVLAHADAGERAAAQEMLQRFSARTPPWRQSDFIAAHHLPALMALCAGDNDTAIAEARQARAYAETYGGAHQIAQQDRLLAMALAAKGDAAATEHAERIRAVAAQTHNATFRLNADMADALLAHAQGRHDAFAPAWVKTAQAALALGQRRIAGMNGPLLARLANQALHDGVDADATRRLIALWRLPPPAGEAPHALWPYAIEIKTLGGFGVTIDGRRAMTGGGKAQRKPLEMLWHLVAAGADGLAQAELADHLWPDLDGDRAILTLRTTVYRLRKLLSGDAIRYADDRIWLDAAIVRTDLGRLRAALDRLQDTTRSTTPRLDAFDTALHFYDGPFLPGVPLAAIAAERDRIAETLAREGAALLAEQTPDDPATVLRRRRLHAKLDPPAATRGR
ncbi:hypothetical protein [Reyranella sp. CPCC 100927]|uniref:hypothetical protein n=1 Tax=Reyranella sp. CPCC 100927 TaxID=2599616 RepID=UPI0011B3D879|nr:hypothetical protein [Reyranella sp. CPCC 100927]TWS97539.1 hypothetical protein FQU96_36995 [Reyranella sp. CPCC 100927]